MNKTEGFWLTVGKMSKLVAKDKYNGVTDLSFDLVK